MKFSLVMLPAVAYGIKVGRVHDPFDFSDAERLRYAKPHDNQSTYRESPDGIPYVGGDAKGWENTQGGLPRYPGMPAFRLSHKGEEP